MVKLESKEEVNDPATVINFTVSKNKTYFADGFAVHNRKADDPIVPGDARQQINLQV